MVVTDAIAAAAKKDLKKLRAGNYPVRRCLTYHECFWCEQPIFLGEEYRDGGYGRRIHQTCYEADELHPQQEQKGK